MNVGNILALADLIEKQPHVSAYAKKGFNMDLYTHPCGTPSCIAGWAAFAAGEADTEAISRAALRHLDLNFGQGDKLFFPPDAEWARITPAQAAKCLRNLAATGVVDWKAALSDTTSAPAVSKATQSADNAHDNA